MRWWRHLGWVCGSGGAVMMVLTVVGVCWPRGGVRAAEAPVTWSRQVAPVVYRSCAPCHHAGEAGPFALTSYAEAKRWGGAMESVTASRYMPPWLPEPGHGRFEDERPLPAEEIALIRRWVEGGMPEGDPAEAPKPPTYGSDWALGSRTWWWRPRGWWTYRPRGRTCFAT